MAVSNFNLFLWFFHAIKNLFVCRRKLLDMMLWKIDYVGKRMILPLLLFYHVIFFFLIVIQRPTNLKDINCGLLFKIKVFFASKFQESKF
jgi:hypothetical protein